MKQSRLDELSDGIFAIVMTLLVFELKVPELHMPVTNFDLFVGLHQLVNPFLSYVLSFSLLFTYWRAHHYIASVYAKNIDGKLTNINALFFFLVGLVPFTTSLLGKYSDTQAAIAIYGVHMILISLTILWMREYVFESEEIKNIKVSKVEYYNGQIRTYVPIISALLAICVSFIDIKLSLAIYTFAILFNLSHASTGILNSFIKEFKDAFK
jgi:uncharacterized membrane protein